MLTVKELRQKGFSVVIHHCREHKYYPNLMTMDSKDYDSRGGCTKVYISYDYKLVAKGTAMCSYKDNYDKKLGVRIALGRALKTANIEGVL